MIMIKIVILLNPFGILFLCIWPILFIGNFYYYSHQEQLAAAVRL